MGVRPIILWPDPRLKQRCAAVEDFDQGLEALAQDLLDTMYASKGRGLASPQVGILRRVFVMDAGWKGGDPDPLVLINPDILSMSDLRETGPESCLSIPGISLDVSRATSLRLRWTTLQRETAEQEFTGTGAIIAQHEFDHLDGIVTIDRIAPEARAKLIVGHRA